MSYSRWGTSVWYTYWTSYSEETNFKLPTKRLKNNQVFEICDLNPYYVRYEELTRLGVDKIVQLVKEHYLKDYETNMFDGFDEDKEPIYTKRVIEGKEYTEEQLNELKGYLNQFIEDVDEHFKWKNFFRYEWYYPIRNKIIWKLRDLRKNICLSK